jgi:hypothetical protein
MREIDKSIQKKKQMKTTTILMTLLIAVALISSSAVTAATTKTNVEDIVTDNGDGQTAPLGGGGDTRAGMSGDPQLSDSFDKTIMYEGSNRGSIVFDNGMNYNGFLSAQDDSYIPLYTECADDFILGGSQAVNDIHWIGGYWHGDLAAEFDWKIRFYNDDGTGNAPGALFAGPFVYNWAAIDKVDLGSGYFELSVNLPTEVTFGGGTKYWISIQGIGDFPPQSGWGRQDDPASPNFQPGVFYGPYFGYYTWTPSTVAWGIWRELCFQLTYAADHDVYVEEIIAPNALSAFCPCTPVDVTVTNNGINDETNVPVTVEIRSYQTDIYEFSDSTFMPEWLNFPSGANDWHESTGSGGVLPHSGGYMALFDSGQFASGSAFLETQIPIDISEKCHAMLSFYMWHDDYGSDDLINVWVYDSVGGWNQVGGPYERLCCPDCPQGWIEHTIDLYALGYDELTGTIQIGFEGIADGVAGAYDLYIDTVNVYDQEYMQTELINIDAGETLSVEFPEWCPCHWQEIAYMGDSFAIQVIACTELDIDQIPINDCVIDDFSVFMPFMHDIAAISIDEPVGRVPVQTFDMCGTIKNVGQYQECCFSVYMTVEEQYIVGGSPAFDILTEDFESWPPAGWTITMFPWDWQTWQPNTNTGLPNYAGGNGVAATCDSDYWYWGCGGEMFTPSFSTVGAPSPVLDFTASYLYLCCGEYFEVAISTNGMAGPFVPLLTWMSSHDPFGPGEPVSIPLPSGFANCVVRITYDDTGGWMYWAQVDDVHIYQPEIAGTPMYYEPEYEEQFCVDTIDFCQEMQICFDQWTPDPIGAVDCGEVVYKITLETKLCDPPDENIFNNKVFEFLTVEFWHDLAINRYTHHQVHLEEMKSSLKTLMILGHQMASQSLIVVILKHGYKEHMIPIVLQIPQRYGGRYRHQIKTNG